MANFCPPFLLIRIDGVVDEFDDQLSVAAAAMHRRIFISTHHVFHTDYGDTVTSNWIVRDSLGQIVTADDLAAVMPSRRNWWSKRFGLVRQAMERGLPIPRTGRRHRGHYFRRNRFIGYNRACAAAAADERDWPTRPTGKVAYLPTNYDDIPVSVRDDRSWKRFRSTQWKP
jgi:hypothetical protein